MANGEWTLERGETIDEIEPVRQLLIETFEEVEAISPVMTVREVDESGQVAFVNRPLLPVAQAEYPINEMYAATSTQGIIEAVSVAAKYPSSLLTGVSRAGNVNIARHVAMYLARELVAPQPSYPELGKEFHRDHSTVMSAVRNIRALVLSGENDPVDYAKKQKVSTLIAHASALIERGRREDDEVAREIGRAFNIMCLCSQGLVTSPILNIGDRERRELYVRVTDNKSVLKKAILDWERAYQAPDVYKRFGEAAYRLARNMLQKKREPKQLSN